MKLHDSTELNKEDAVQGGSKNYYYHPDCFHTMKTINRVKDLFVKEINPALTAQQIGMLMSTVNNIVFTKGIDVDMVLFALEYFIRYKPGALRYPAGLHYIVQDKDVIDAWQKEKDRRLRQEIKAQMSNLVQEDEGESGLNLGKNTVIYKSNSKSRFSTVLGV